MKSKLTFIKCSVVLLCSFFVCHNLKAQIKPKTDATNKLDKAGPIVKPNAMEQPVRIHYIGEKFGGGVVFYVYDNGKHGLIATDVDVPKLPRGVWYNGVTKFIGANGDTVGAGKKNTELIIQAAIKDKYEENFVAKGCAEYSVTIGSVTYRDWYLPSIYELNLLYQHQEVLSDNRETTYWSSTEEVEDKRDPATGYHAWVLSFLHDRHQLPAKYNKGSEGYCRPIRSF